MKRRYISAALLAFFLLFFAAERARAYNEWHFSDSESFELMIVKPYYKERFLQDESIRLIISTKGNVQSPRAYVFLTHEGVHYRDLATSKVKVFDDAYFYEYDSNLRADLDVANVVPGRYKLWVQLMDDATGETAYATAVCEIVEKSPDDKGWQLAGAGNYYFLRGQDAVRNCWLYMNGRWYAFDNAAIMQRNWSLIDDCWYLFDNNGGMIFGWWEENTFMYYLGAYGRMATGWREIDGTTYYFYENGRMATGTVSMDGQDYEFGEDGKLLSGDAPEVTPDSDATIAPDPVIEE